MRLANLFSRRQKPSVHVRRCKQRCTSHQSRRMFLEPLESRYGDRWRRTAKHGVCILDCSGIAPRDLRRPRRTGGTATSTIANPENWP
jgi:hypothetical protein